MVAPVILYDKDKSRLHRVKRFLTERFMIGDEDVYMCELPEETIAQLLLSRNGSENLFYQVGKSFAKLEFLFQTPLSGLLIKLS